MSRSARAASSAARTAAINSVPLVSGRPNASVGASDATWRWAAAAGARGKTALPPPIAARALAEQPVTGRVSAAPRPVIPLASNARPPARPASSWTTTLAAGRSRARQTTPAVTTPPRWRPIAASLAAAQLPPISAVSRHAIRDRPVATRHSVTKLATAPLRSGPWGASAPMLRNARARSAWTAFAVRVLAVVLAWRAVQERDFASST